MLAGQPYEHPAIAACPGLRQRPIPHASEVLVARKFEAANHDDAPARLKELVGLVDLERADRVKSMVVDLAVRGPCGR
jgi:hypothetical protein